MAEMSTVARPYAKAAFDIAVEAQAVEKWQEMLEFASLVAQNESISELLNGALAADKLAEIFNQVCGEQVNEQGQNLIKVMAENGRLSVLPEVAALYAGLRNEWAQEIEAEVISAVSLTEAQQASIAGALEKRLSRKVKLNCSVNADLIAGFIVKADDLVIDGSARGKIDRLADTLQS
ncbi:F0F1 ATP synthase subunit delta [Paraferrimonas sp. SM1919]|uniref:F0F1 ATP synthase subunit delta n=1 Tax=Paraferrimonas sp. SM1919 TaxID=2662263 RepID=UPI0013D78CEB|nr:F0F1 ATP synthase subunit delta [Paraferrimonas sp. SM1919]